MRLVEENRRRNRQDPEFELVDTGVFAENRYFDVTVEYAKASPEDILVRISVTNHGPEPATIDLLPTIWFRNTWSWGEDDAPRPSLRDAGCAVELDYHALGRRVLACQGTPELLFTENETNLQRLFHVLNAGPYVKDGINDYIVHRASAAVNPSRRGTKAVARYTLTMAPGETRAVRLRIMRVGEYRHAFGPEFDRIFADRMREADEIL